MKTAARLEAGWPALKPAGGCELGLNIYIQAYLTNRVTVVKQY